MPRPAGSTRGVVVALAISLLSAACGSHLSHRQILEASGFEVVLVNSRHVKNLPGRKSDVLDCQWLQKLHTHGLLSGSFRP